MNAPVELGHADKVVTVQVVDAHIHQIPPHSVPQRNRPLRRAPVPDFQSALVRTLDLPADKLALFVTQMTKPNAPNALLEVGARVERVRRVEVGGWCSSHGALAAGADRAGNSRIAIIVLRLVLPFFPLGLDVQTVEWRVEEDVAVGRVCDDHVEGRVACCDDGDGALNCLCAVVVSEVALFAQCRDLAGHVGEDLRAVVFEVNEEDEGLLSRCVEDAEFGGVIQFRGGEEGRVLVLVVQHLDKWVHVHGAEGAVLGKCVRAVADEEVFVE